MRFYRKLSLHRRVQVVAFGLLLTYQIGGFFLALGFGASRDEILIGLGIEMVGAVFTAMGVAYLDKSFTLAFEDKYGDPVQHELSEIRSTLNQFEQQIQTLITLNSQQAQALEQQEIQNQLLDLQKQQHLLTTYMRYTGRQSRR